MINHDKTAKPLRLFRVSHHFQTGPGTHLQNPFRAPSFQTAVWCDWCSHLNASWPRQMSQGCPNLPWFYDLLGGFNPKCTDQPHLHKRFRSIPETKGLQPKTGLVHSFPQIKQKKHHKSYSNTKKWVSIVFNQKRKFITWSWDVSIVFPWKNHQNLPISGVARAFSPRWPDDHGGSRLSWEARNGKCCRGNWMTYGDFMGFPSSPWKSQSLSSSCCDLPTAKRLLNCDWKLVPTQAEAAPGKENWSSQTTLSDRIGSHFWWD